MSAVSGVVSRQVLPACGSLCFFCPGLRARSRQPVKRYKKLIADIFPKNQVRLSSKGCLLLVFQVCCLLFVKIDRQMLIYVYFCGFGKGLRLCYIF